MCMESRYAVYYPLEDHLVCLAVGFLAEGRHGHRVTAEGGR